MWFTNLDNPHKIFVGPWSHQGKLAIWSHSEKLSLTRFLEVEHLRWYDYWLKGIDNGVMQESPVVYDTMGDSPKQGLHTTWQWPLPEEQPTNYYFTSGPSGSVNSANDGLLSTSAPASPAGQDDYEVDYSASTGTGSRWFGATGRPKFSYPNMVGNDEKSLTYTTPPLEAEVEVTGHPVIHLWITSSTRDGDFFAYLEDVQESGTSGYVTEGTLRASYRALSTPPYDRLGLPYHEVLADEGLELPTEPVELVFDLQPTSYVFSAGHRIRVTITGADADNAQTPRLKPPPMVSVYRSSTYPSYIVLPVIP